MKEYYYFRKFSPHNDYPGFVFYSKSGGETRYLDETKLFDTKDDALVFSKNISDFDFDIVSIIWN